MFEELLSSLPSDLNEHDLVLETVREVVSSYTEKSSDEQLINIEENLIRLGENLTRMVDVGTEYQRVRLATWLTTYITNLIELTHSDAMFKTWVTEFDERVRDPHAFLHGWSVPLTEPFNVGGMKLQFPGEPIGDPKYWINCRCRLRMSTTASKEIPMNEIRWHGVLAPEGIESGDKRTFSPGSLTWRDLPLPLNWQKESSNGHDGSVIVGRIDTIERVDGKIVATGVFVNSPEADEVVGLMAEGALRGVSVDIDSAEMSFNELDESMLLSKGRISAATLCSIPAFAEAMVVLGDEEPLTASANTSFSIPNGVKEEARRGLGWHKKFGRGGTDVGVNTARTLVSDETVGVEKIKHIAAYFPRHEVDKEAEGYRHGEDGFPSNGRIAWALWGGDEGRRWATNIVNSLQEASCCDEFVISESKEKLDIDDYTDEEWRAATILHYEEDYSEKAMHCLPIFESNGHLNRQAVYAASEALSEVVSEEAREGAVELLKLAFEALGEEVPQHILSFKRGKGWITNPEATRQIHKYWTSPGQPGFAKIGWGTPGAFRRCRRELTKYVNPLYLNRTCAQWYHDAVGIWPGVKRGDKAALDGHALHLVSSAHKPLDAELFTNPQLDGPTPIRLESGRVFGHLATWGTCHVGISGVCTQPPRSASNYAYFHTGSISTTKGYIPVGQITMDTGHAQLSDGPHAAASHYDNTGTAVADVVVGEDNHGIWVSGALRNVSADQERAFTAGALSGDWRSIGGNLELVAALVVNVPGFPVIAASADGQSALIRTFVVDQKLSLRKKMLKARVNYGL